MFKLYMVTVAVAALNCYDRHRGVSWTWNTRRVLVLARDTAAASRVVLDGLGGLKVEWASCPGPPRVVSVEPLPDGTAAGLLDIDYTTPGQVAPCEGGGVLVYYTDTCHDWDGDGDEPDTTPLGVLHYVPVAGGWFLADSVWGCYPASDSSADRLTYAREVAAEYFDTAAPALLAGPDAWRALRELVTLATAPPRDETETNPNTAA